MASLPNVRGQVPSQLEMGGRVCRPFPRIEKAIQRPLWRQHARLQSRRSSTVIDGSRTGRCPGNPASVGNAATTFPASTSARPNKNATFTGVAPSRVAWPTGAANSPPLFRRTTGRRRLPAARTAMC